MATSYFFGIDRGDTKTGVTVGSTTTSTLDVEVRFDMDDGVDGKRLMTKREAYAALDAIRDYIVEHNWPPA
jgi:hypothetical protein